MGLRLDNSKPKPVESNEFFQALTKNKTTMPSYQSVKTSQMSITKGFASQQNQKRDKEVREEYDIQSVDAGSKAAGAPDTMFDPKVMSEHLQSSQQNSEEKILDATRSKQDSEYSINKLV